jgi:hypothetical protein
MNGLMDYLVAISALDHLGSRESGHDSEPIFDGHIDGILLGYYWDIIGILMDSRY